MGEAHSLAERYELLLDVSEILELNRDLNSLLGALCDLPASIGLFDYVNLLLYDAPTDTMTLFSQGDVGGGYARIDGLAPTEGPGQVVWARQRPFVCSGEEYRRHFLKIAALRRNQRVGLYCQMPLTTSQRRLGGVEFISSRPTTYDEDDLTFLRRVASVIAISVENALIGEMRQMEEERLRGERDHNHILVEVTNAVISKLKLEDLVDEVSRSIHRFFGVDFVSLDLVDPATATIKSRSVYFQKGLGPVWGSAQGPLGASPMAPLFETKAPRILARADLGALARGHDQMTLLTNAGFQVACGIPLLSAGHVLGVLTLASRERDKFTDYNIGLLGEVASRICIAVENALAYGEISRLKDQLSRENKQLAKERYYLEEEIRRTEDFGDIIGISPAIRGVLEQVELVADSDSTVLILGETGTGKELIARAIHMLSQRKKRTMIKVNCAAIPSALLESDLFGHEKGAFTGAIAQKSGRFELADRGTLFLDEVGDIPIDLQPKLLRALQEREIERVGGHQPIPVDVRMIAATNRDLTGMVEKRLFRGDLYYRLNVFPILIPPLRERREDIPLMADYFMRKTARKMNRAIEAFSAETMDMLLNLPWPGNVRELQNVIERAVILTKGPVLHLPATELRHHLAPSAALPSEDAVIPLRAAVLPSAASAPDPLPPPAGSSPNPGDLAGEAIERDQILRVLRETNGIVGGPRGAAAHLGMKRTTLLSRMRRLGISPKEVDHRA